MRFPCWRSRAVHNSNSSETWSIASGIPVCWVANSVSWPERSLQPPCSPTLRIHITNCNRVINSHPRCTLHSVGKSNKGIRVINSHPRWTLHSVGKINKGIRVINSHPRCTLHSVGKINKGMRVINSYPFWSLHSVGKINKGIRVINSHSRCALHSIGKINKGMRVLILDFTFRRWSHGRWLMNPFDAWIDVVRQTGMGRGQIGGLQRTICLLNSPGSVYH